MERTTVPLVAPNIYYIYYKNDADHLADIMRYAFYTS